MDYKALYEQQLQENKKLKDFTNWENHPALKHKVVLDDDHYLHHLNEEGQLIHPDELEELQDKVNDREQKISDILSFIAGNYDKEDIVKALIKEEFTEEYIKCNGEFWSAVGIDFDDEKQKLKKELEYERKVSFWRMCESYNGFHKNTNLRHPEWIAEMNEQIEDKADLGPVGVKELQEGYLEFVGGYETVEEDED